jgi:hypothetical protein
MAIAALENTLLAKGNTRLVVEVYTLAVEDG